jgi:raffinose/stachyose/melibiose transport system substrate-binding protein
MLRTTRAAAVVAAALLAATTAACAGGGGGGSAPATSPDGKTVLTWWHNATQDTLKNYFQDAANRYTAAHPDVTFQIEPVQNETIQTKIRVALQSNDPPDLFQQWGGGDLATQVESGKVADITDSTQDIVKELGPTAKPWQVDGKQYGLPYSVGVVGFWYRTDLFSQAGITTPPKTMDELYTDVDKLKAAGITPIALGGKDKWPDAFYWAYFATRECSQGALEKVTADTAMADPCFVKAGQDVQQLIAKQPFQDGFLATPAQEGAASSAGMMANGKAAMELQGHWNGGQITGLTPDKKSLGDKLSWFPFPAVAGGQGAPTATLGGGDGFSCSASAPPACADFLKFLASDQEQSTFGATGTGLPAAPGAESSVTDTTVKGVLEARGATPYNQLYFDKALPTDVGLALNDEIANLFAGTSDPQKVVDAVAEAAKSR